MGPAWRGGTDPSWWDQPGSSSWALGAKVEAPGCFAFAVNKEQVKCKQLAWCELKCSGLCPILAWSQRSCPWSLASMRTPPAALPFPLQSPLAGGCGGFELTWKEPWEHSVALYFEIRPQLFSKISPDLSLWINIFSSEGLHHCQEWGISPTSGNKNLYSTCSAWQILFILFQWWLYCLFPMRAVLVSPIILLGLLWMKRWCFHPGLRPQGMSLVCYAVPE